MLDIALQTRPTADERISKSTFGRYQQMRVIACLYAHDLQVWRFPFQSAYLQAQPHIGGVNMQRGAVQWNAVLTDSCMVAFGKRNREKKEKKKGCLHLYQFRKELIHRFCHRIRQRPRGIHWAGNFHHEFLDQAVKRPVPSSPLLRVGAVPTRAESNYRLDRLRVGESFCAPCLSQSREPCLGLRRRWRTLQTDGTQSCHRITRVVASPAPRLKSMSARY